MNRRRILTVAASLALLAVAAVVGCVALPRSAVTQANVDRVRGLTLAEVERLLGGKGEPARTPRFANVHRHPVFFAGNPADVAAVLQWDDGDRTALVWFDADGVAFGGLFMDGGLTGHIRQLPRMLGL